nr:MAG TPA: ParB protein [Caudoviricetes sp.]
MEIVEKKVGELKAYENNPRKNDNAVEAVANSIREFGFKVPIVIDSNDVIVCGHTRLKAAIQLGMETVPCIVANDLSEEQIKAFRLADNKTNELAEWDFSALQMELSEILDIDMTDFGFIEPTDLDINDEDFYKNEKLKEKEKKKVVCPYCGKEFEL